MVQCWAILEYSTVSRREGSEFSEDVGELGKLRAEKAALTVAVPFS